MEMTIHITRTRLLSLLGVVALLAIAVISAPLLAGQPRPVLAADDTPSEHTISVTGTGSVFVAPDVADVSLGVQVQKPNLAPARDEAANRMTAVIAALHALGIDDADIRTTTVDVSPTYDYNMSTPMITGYQVTNMVAVHVRDLDKLAGVIDDSVAAGATTVSGISFDMADRSAAEQQAREAAVHDARSRADTLASTSGVSIVGVASISESYSAPWRVYPVADKGFVEAAAPMPIQPGTSEIVITVSIAYLIG